MKDIQVVTPNEYNYLHSTSTNLSVMTDKIQKLVQEVTMAIKRTPGRDLFSPDIGAGIRRVLPIAQGVDTNQEASMIVVSTISKVEEDIKASQANTNLDAAEQLQSLEVLSAEFDIQQTAWFISIRLTSKSNEQIETIILL